MENLTLQKIVEEILLANNLDKNILVRTKRGRFPGCNLEEFTYKLITHGTVKEFSKNEGWGTTTINRVLLSNFIPIFGKLSGGNETWARVLLNSAKIKKCPSCLEYKRYSEFSLDKHNAYGVDTYCKICKSFINKEFYDTNKKQYHKSYIEEHKQEYNARNAARRANKKSATPPWANLDKIKEIYNNCPVGYHVDHIIPLVGETVCGLHVEYNLQYLTAEDNLKKGNKF